MNLKVRLAVMNFLEFAVWGAYLTSMGNYLGKAGMGARFPGSIPYRESYLFLCLH